MPRDMRALISKLKQTMVYSFGEAVFKYVARNNEWDIVEIHRNNTDYLVKGEPVDVKTTRQTLQRPMGRRTCPAHASDVRCACVDFVLSGACVSIDGAQLQSLDWEKIATIWDEWTRQRGGENGLFEEQDNTKSAIKALQNELGRFFRDKGIETHIIYNRCQKKFGRESPAHLIPKGVMPNRITIFLAFKSDGISADNISAADNFDGVYAFPDTVVAALPMLQKLHLHKPKVDLGKLPAKFVFRDPDDLRRHFRRILA